MDFKTAGVGLTLVAAFALTVGGCVTGCSVKSSDNVYMDTTDIRYDIDTDTGICYAYVGAQQVRELSTRGIGLTAVPATPEVLAKIDPEKLAELEEKGIKPVTWNAGPCEPSAPRP